MMVLQSRHTVTKKKHEAAPVSLPSTSSWLLARGSSSCLPSSSPFPPQLWSRLFTRSHRFFPEPGSRAPNVLQTKTPTNTHAGRQAGHGCSLFRSFPRSFVFHVTLPCVSPGLRSTHSFRTRHGHPCEYTEERATTITCINIYINMQGREGGRVGWEDPGKENGQR